MKSIRCVKVVGGPMSGAVVDVEYEAKAGLPEALAFENLTEESDVIALYRPVRGVYRFDSFRVFTPSN